MSEEPPEDKPAEITDTIKSSWDAGGFVIPTIGGVIVEMPELLHLARDVIEASPDMRRQAFERMKDNVELVFPGLIRSFCEDNKAEIDEAIAEWVKKDAELLGKYLRQTSTTTSMLDGESSTTEGSTKVQEIMSVPERARACYALYVRLYEIAATNNLILHTSKENRRAGAEISGIIARP